MLKFTPPKDEKLPRYASYGAGVFKTHHTLGGAKQSLAYRCGTYNWRSSDGWKEGWILELVDGEWFTLHHVPAGSRDADLPWKADLWTHDRYGWTTHSEPSSKEGYTRTRVTAAMSKEEYAAWRVAVELEKRGIADGGSA